MARLALASAGLLAVVPVAATLVLRHVRTASPMIAAYVAASPYVTIAGAAAIALFVVARSRAGVAVAASLTSVLVLTQAPLYLGTAAPPDTARPLTVMTVNMHFGLGDAADIVGTVRRTGADVLAVQELDSPAVEALTEAGLDELLPHRVVRPDDAATGNGLWSRSALTPLPTPAGLTYPPVAASMAAEGPPIFVASVHARSPYPSEAERWSADIAALADWLGEVKGRAIVAGDFNATIDHRPFRDVLAAGYGDAALQAGAGFLPTYPANRRRLPLLIAIDHVLARGGIVATALERVRIDDTDHESLVAVLAVPDVAPGDP